MITNDKIIEIFCATDEFSKKYEEEIENMPLLSSEGKVRRRRAASMSDSEIMTILIMFHFGTFDNFKHYYLHFIKLHLKSDFPDAVSYNRFVELESRVFFKLMFFLNLHSFGRCTGITFVDSTMIPVCHNLRRYANKVFAGIATDGKGTMGLMDDIANLLLTRLRHIGNLSPSLGTVVPYGGHRGVVDYAERLCAVIHYIDCRGSKRIAAFSVWRYKNLTAYFVYVKMKESTVRVKHHSLCPTFQRIGIGVPFGIVLVNKFPHSRNVKPLT